MSKKEPAILSIIGKSDSGKTTLILKLLPELKRKGYNVAVAKHCPCGFDLDVEGKDSWNFTKAGSKGVYLSSRDKVALIRPKEKGFNLRKKLKEYFKDFPIVLLEGYKDEADIDKIQIMREKIGGELLTTTDILAYVSDMKLETNKPIYNPDDISGIVSFIEGRMK